jgi:hypothetical protein
MGNWTKMGLQGVLDKDAFYLYKYYVVGAEFRTLRNLTVNMKNQWDDWVIFAGVCPRSDVTMITTEAAGQIALSQSLFALPNQIHPASSVLSLVPICTPKTKTGTPGQKTVSWR